jgi:hypothetical protein
MTQAFYEVLQLESENDHFLDSLLIYERGMTYSILAHNICGIFTLHWEVDGIIASINVELSNVLTAEG